MHNTGDSRARKRRRASLRKVSAGWTALPNELLQDAGLSYAARGILGYLLSKPEGWDVRAAAIAAESPRDPRTGRPRESLAAVRRALRDLGAAGYYRIVRQQRPDSAGRLTWVTETWVGRDPSPAWRAEWGTRKGRPVVLRHVPDGAGAPASSPVPAGLEAGWSPGRDAAPVTPRAAAFCVHPDHEYQRVRADGTCPLCAADALADPTL